MCQPEIEGGLGLSLSFFWSHFHALFPLFTAEASRAPKMGYFWAPRLCSFLEKARSLPGAAAGWALGGAAALLRPQRPRSPPEPGRLHRPACSTGPKLSVQTGAPGEDGEGCKAKDRGSDACLPVGSVLS